MASDFGEQMERGRVAAVRDRNRGLHVGKVAKGWNRARHHDPRPFQTLKMMVECWKVERDTIVNNYRLFAYEPEFDWENFR